MRIDMSHGSGGKASALLMSQIFGKHFSNETLDRLEDAAVLELDGAGRIAVSTDSFVVQPLFFRGGDIGKLAVCGTVNDLLMMGATPRYLTAGFILEEGLELETLERVVASMAETARKAGVQIVAGDTKVVEGKGGLFINTAGIGQIPADRNLSASSCSETDVVLLSGNLGDHHACILGERMGIDSQIQSDCGVLTEVVTALFDAGVVVKTMRDVTRGGLGTVLNELAISSQCSIEILETAIPVHPEVRGFCEILGLDPIYMANEGKLVAIVKKEEAELALSAMKQTSLGKEAAIIGHCNASENPGIVTMKTRLGGKRMIDVLYGEGLPRIC